MTEVEHSRVLVPDWAKAKKHSTKPSKTKSPTESINKTAFILGTALIYLAATRNTVTWQKLWGAFEVLSSVGGNDFILFTFGTNIVTSGIYWSVGCCFLYIDITKPNWALKYKIQNEQKTTVDRAKLTKSIKCVLLNQVVGFLFSIAVYKLFVWRGMPFGSELPTFQCVLFEIAVFALVLEFVFYYSHRLFHHPKIYKYFHKKHHEWTAPVGIISIYAHPLEHLIANLSPIMLGPFLMGSHIATAWLWFFVAITSTNISHSGYHFPYLPSPEAHDFHHLNFNQNYGILGVLDRLHGTDTLFRNSVCYDRHILMIGLQPVREAFPDPKAKENYCK